MAVTDSPYQPLMVSHLEAKFIFNLSKLFTNITFFSDLLNLMLKKVFFIHKVDSLLPPSNPGDQQGGLMITFLCSFARLLQLCL